MLKFVTLLSSLLLLASTGYAKSQKLRKLSPNVYEVVGIGGPKIKLSSPAASAGSPLTISRRHASRERMFLKVWTGQKFRNIGKVGPGRRDVTIPARYISNRSRLFVVETKRASAAFIVDADNRKINRGLVTLFESQVHVFLRNNISSDIGYQINGNEMKSLAPGEVKMIGSKAFGFWDIRQVRITIRVPMNKPGQNTASLNFLNPSIGYPTAFGEVGDSHVGFNYAEGEEQNYFVDGYRLRIRREGDNDGKVFHYVISNN